MREHGDRVYRLAYRLSGNQHDAEDITQETFIRVFRSLDNFQPGSFEGWLHRITTNVFLDMVRRRQRIRMEALPEETDRIAGREPSPEQAFEDANLDPDLQAALDELLPEFRAALVLCDVEGLTYEEIGADPGRQARHCAVPDPPWPAGAAGRSGTAAGQSWDWPGGGGAMTAGCSKTTSTSTPSSRYADGEMLAGRLPAGRRARRPGVRMCDAEVSRAELGPRLAAPGAGAAMPGSLARGVVLHPGLDARSEPAARCSVDPRTGGPVRAERPRGAPRHRRFRFLGAGALIAGLAVGAFAAVGSTGDDGEPNPPGPPPSGTHRVPAGPGRPGPERPPGDADRHFRLALTPCLSGLR